MRRYNDFNLAFGALIDEELMDSSPAAQNDEIRVDNLGTVSVKIRVNPWQKSKILPRMNTEGHG